MSKEKSMMNGNLVDGAYWSEKRFDKFDGQISEGLSQHKAILDDYRTGSIAIWAHNQDEAMDIAENFTADELESYVGWFHTGQIVDMNAPKIGQTAEHPMRLVTLILRDQDGLNVTLHAINIQTVLSDEEIIPAIKAASRDYLNTPEGRKVWEDNCHNFNYGDFDLYVSNEFCMAHGFYRITKKVPDIIEDDFNITLAELEKGEE